MSTESIDDSPQKEPVEIELNDDVPSEILEIQLRIKTLAEQNLYQWKSFPIVLPETITDQYITDEEGHSTPIISFKDIFLAPDFDELEIVAKDNNGMIKHLNSVQLQTVRSHGKFDVSSANFPGQVHSWKITQLLQKGSELARETMLDDVALSLSLITIKAKNRIYSKLFSVSEGIRCVTSGLWQSFDCIFGLPNTSPGYLESRLREEHMKFLVAELKLSHPTSKEGWERFCNYVKDKCEDGASFNLKPDVTAIPLPQYQLQTPTEQDIDLRLFNKDLMSHCLPLVENILEKESEGWYVKFKDRLLADMRSEELSVDEIFLRLDDQVQAEYLRRVFESINRSEDINALSPGLGKLLVQEARATVLMQKAVIEATQKMNSQTFELKKYLKKAYPVRSRIKQWINHELFTFKNEFVRLNQWTPHESAMEMCKENQLDQAAYFIHRDLLFIRDREPVLLQELSKVRVPSRRFAFPQRIWFPSEWIIKRVQFGEEEVVPTVVVEEPRSHYVSRAEDEPEYIVVKYTYWKNSTESLFWRWKNYLIRTWTWTWNTMFWLGVALPWCSPVSFRALIYRKPFIPSLELNPVNGALSPQVSSKTETVVSRLSNLWSSVSESRASFEAEPETGFLGKGFTRQFNRFWNYVIKGALGSCLLVLGFAPFCIIASTLSIIVALISPLWMPCAVFGVHLFFFIAYDFDSPETQNPIMGVVEAVIWQFIIQGLLQPVAALVCAVLVFPVSSAAVFIYALGKRAGRGLWDSLIYHFVISKQARVPIKDTFIARRIAGPGLAADYFCQATAEQILAAVEAHLELQELTVWEEYLRDMLEKPKLQYRHFVRQMFGPFSVDLVQTGVYDHVAKQTADLMHEIGYQVERRKKVLLTGLSNKTLCEKIKLPTKDLKTVRKQTTKLVRKFFSERIFNKLIESEATFWEKRQLQDGDWRGLASKVLTEVFSPHFLIPLEDTDETVFKLEVKHLDLSRYLQMINEANVHDDLDEADIILTPQGDFDILEPFFSVDNFDPSQGDPAYPELAMRRRLAGQKSRGPAEESDIDEGYLHKLHIPLPIMHPAFINIHVYNRENDADPIEVDEPSCRKIITAAEDVPYVDNPTGTTTTTTVLPEDEKTSAPSEPEIKYRGRQTIR